MDESIQLVTEQAMLTSLCETLSQSRFITIDTEFIRERTYWPQLCLVQLARPEDVGDAERSYLVDPMAGLDLEPLFALMRNPNVLKVFHAARQDIEIFVHLMGDVPAPIFDTQVAAMVCGYGDQVGYETLVRRIASASLDKSSRFTDWARRPLSDKQLRYAAGDVTHLRTVYQELAAQLAKTGRESWVESEMEVLCARSTYVTEPEEAWRRIKTRSGDKRFLGIVRALAAWREEEAQARDVPRGRLLKDDAVLEIAAAAPTDREQLGRLRSLQREARKPETADRILAAVGEGVQNPAATVQKQRQRKQRPGGQALAELLKVLLKANADRLGVAQRLIASAADIDQLANDPEDDMAVLRGWRRDAFGDDAMKLIRGEIALSAGRSGVQVVAIEPEKS